MSATFSQEPDLESFLTTLVNRHDVAQVLLFGPEGKPFYVGRPPLSERHLGVLGDALDFIEVMEERQPKPFLGRNGSGGYLVAALGGWSDFYLVAIENEATRPAAEARVATMRDEVLSWAGKDPERRELLGARENPVAG